MESRKNDAEGKLEKFKAADTAQDVPVEEKSPEDTKAEKKNSNQTWAKLIQKSLKPVVSLPNHRSYDLPEACTELACRRRDLRQVDSRQVECVSFGLHFFCFF